MLRYILSLLASAALSACCATVPPPATTPEPPVPEFTDAQAIEIVHAFFRAINRREVRPGRAPIHPDALVLASGYPSSLDGNDLVDMQRDSCRDVSVSRVEQMIIYLGTCRFRMVQRENHGTSGYTETTMVLLVPSGGEWKVAAWESSDVRQLYSHPGPQDVPQPEVP